MPARAWLGLVAAVIAAAGLTVTIGVLLAENATWASAGWTSAGWSAAVVILPALMALRLLTHRTHRGARKGGEGKQ